jgi:hypothetical protein
MSAIPAGMENLKRLDAPWFEVRRASPELTARMLDGSLGAAMILGPDALMEMRRPTSPEHWRWGGFHAGAWMGSERVLGFTRAAWGNPNRWAPGRYRKEAHFVFETPDVVIAACMEPGKRGNAWSAALKGSPPNPIKGGVAAEAMGQWPDHAVAQVGIALRQIVLANARADADASSQMEKFAPGWLARAHEMEQDDPALKAPLKRIKP